ncbi:hypothetical protein SGCOL_009885 [Colletotrichum sp. CLE4]
MASSPDKDLTHETVYDEDWWVKNSREHPDSPIALPPLSSPAHKASGDSNSSNHTNTSNITIPATAIHTHDTTAADISALRPPGNPHAPFLLPPPAKEKNKGQWAYVEYIPAWTDPLWQDKDSRVQDKDNPIHILRRRDWMKNVRPAQLPQDRSQNPSAFALRLIYQSGNVKGEWDPKTNDYLWQKMQPALLLASRILDHLETTDPFWRRLHDPLNRRTIGEPRDYRTPEMRKKNPAVQFTLHDYDDAGKNAIVDEQTRKQLFDVKFEVLKLLNHSVRFMLCSGQKDGGDTTTAGSTCVSGANIDIYIAADAFWPLVVPGYSDDERLLQSFFLASTIVHEIAHAVNYAHHLVLKPPAGIRITAWVDSPDKVKKAREIGEQMFPKITENSCEPFFEDEPQAELGFCTENRLFGGIHWNLMSTEMSQLFFLPAALAMERWPRPKGEDGHLTLEQLQKHPENLTLDHTPMLPDQYLVPTRVTHITRLFTETFWGTEVSKYGPAALRFGGLDPVTFPIIRPRVKLGAALRGVLAPRGDRALELLPRESSDEMADAGPMLAQFLMQAATEFLRPHVARYRWTRDHEHFLGSRCKEAYKLVFQLVIIMNETGTAFDLRRITEEFENGRRNQTSMDAWKRSQSRRWGKCLDKWLRESREELDGRPCSLPYDSVHPHKENEFWKSIHSHGWKAGQRMAEVLRQIYEMIVFEIGCFHQMFFDIYNLDEAELEAFEREQAAQDLPFRRQITMNLTTEALAKTTEVVTEYSRNGFIPVANLAVIHDFMTKFTNMRAQLEELKPWMNDISKIKPANFNLLQPFVPRLKTARRPATSRMVKVAQKELGMVPVETVVVIEKFLSFVKTTVKAAGDVRIDLARDGAMDLDEVITEFEKSDKFGQPRVVEDVIEDYEDGLDNNDPLTDIIRKRRPKNPWNGAKHPPKRPRIATPQLVPQLLEHPTPFSKYSPPKYRFGDTTKASRFHRASLINAVPDPTSNIPNVFANIPDVTFPLSQSFSGFAGYGPGQQPPPKLPTHASVFGSKPIQIADGPEPMGIFPHPFALSATFREDLEHEARARLMLAHQGPANAVLAFRERQGATAANAYRDPAPAIPDSPEKDGRRNSGTPGFGVGGNRRRRIPDPQDWLPYTEGLESLSSYSDPDVGRVNKGKRAVRGAPPATDEDENEDGGSHFGLCDPNKFSAVSLQRERFWKQQVMEYITEQQRQRQGWLNSLATPVVPAVMLATDMRPTLSPGPLGGASTSAGRPMEGGSAGPSSASSRQQGRYFPGDMDWVPG